MKLKYSIIVSLSSLILGFIPFSFSNKNEITYTIYSDNIVLANKAKEELIVFYKQYCYSSLFDDIESKIYENIDKFDYNVSYDNHNFTVILKGNEIKMTGYLYKNSLFTINYKNYFTSVTYSIPLATSINVATDALSDQI